MNPLQQALIVLVVIGGSVEYAAAQGWLGPYGLPGDTLHLLLLASVLFFTYLMFWYTTLRHGWSLTEGLD